MSPVGRYPPVSRCLYAISLPGLGLTRILPFKAREGPCTGMALTEKSGQSTTCARFLGAADSVRFPDIEYRANKRPLYHSSTDQPRQVSNTSLPAYKTRWTMPGKNRATITPPTAPCVFRHRGNNVATRKLYPEKQRRCSMRSGIRSLAI